jgi:hypothetical protein
MNRMNCGTVCRPLSRINTDGVILTGDFAEPVPVPEPDSFPPSLAPRRKKPDKSINTVLINITGNS